MAPQSHPQAQFVPISPDFDLNALVENTSNFDYVTRLSTEKLKEHSIQSFEALVLTVVIQSGKPLVIEDWGESLPPWLFSPKWIQDNLGSKPEQVRDIPNEVNIPMTIGHYIRSMGVLANRITPATYKDPKRQRLYLKDIDTPEGWANHLEKVMPESVYYLNDCIEPRTGGDGAIREPNEYGQMVYGKGVAPAGDLMSSLPPEMRAMNMMCYIGHEGTYTPAHREMCASLGHNLMVETSEDKDGERAGSSIWFMTETKEREVVSEYFLSMLGHDIEVEKHFAQVNAWKKAPFNVWIVEQKVGDLILIPPLAPHQVWNRGTRTMKAAWNRTTVDTLELALHEALPRARMVCREEQYKNKAIIYYTLMKYYDLLQRDTVEPKMWKYGRIKQVIEDFKRLFSLYTEVIVSEMFSPKLPEEEDVEFLAYDSNVTCSYCRGNIFNRFLTCKNCIQVVPNGDEDTYDICMDCYAMGRSCACISDLKWVEQWSWDTLVQDYEKWRGFVVQADGFFDIARSPQVLEVARKRYGRKPVAEVCQEQLRIRPWNDITKPQAVEPLFGESDSEPEVDDEGRLKKKKGKKSARVVRKVFPTKNKTHACHICCHHDYNWKLAFCSTCSLAYCYGVLWRAFDLMPQTVMEDKEWSCPRCLKMCSCGRCRRPPTTQKPYAPKGTLLGHDTKKVADYRSVESLVDFSKTNLTWLRPENEENQNPQESSRMKKLKEKAEVEKARVETNDNYFDGVAPTSFSATNEADPAQYGSNHEIDPLLLNGGESSASNNQFDASFDAPFGQEDFENNDDGHISNSELDQHLNVDWVDNNGQYNFNDYEANNTSNQQQASYPSRLTAPIAPMMAPEQSYPDPSNIGQTRMMGAGFYQQGSGVDRILFDAPIVGDTSETILQQTASQNPNFAFSDLLDPVLQPEEVKKRKRHGHDGTEDEEEFYTSKRQRKLAESKKAKREHGDNDDVSHDPKPVIQRAPRRSVGKAQYEDLGEDAVPIEDDEGLSSVSVHHRKRKPENPDSDMELAAQALSRLSNPQPVQSPATVARKRGRPKKGEERQVASASASPASNTIRTPRKSAWLARKGAGGRETNDDPPKRTRLSRGSFADDKNELPKSPIDISSDEEDSDDGGVRIEEDTDSIFDEPIESEAGSEGGVRWRASEENPQVQLASPRPLSEILEPREPRSEDENDERTIVVQPAANPRGRPRKTPLPVDPRSPSPIEEAQPVPIKKLLSLKEKLALKGKSFKIVAPQAKQTQGTPSSGLPVGSSSPVITLKSILKTPTATSMSPGWSKNGELAIPGPSRDTSSTSTSTLQRSTKKTVTLAAPEKPPVAPVSTGPTVVRLVSPDTEEGDSYESQSEHSERPHSEVDSDSDDDSDASIPAVRPAISRLGGSLSGRGGSFHGTSPMTSGGRGRGRGRPRGRPHAIRD